MSSCGACNTGCKCSNGCGCSACGCCKMSPDMEAAVATKTMVFAAPSHKGSSGGFESATESGGCGCTTCKCSTSCGGCSCCSCN